MTPIISDASAGGAACAEGKQKQQNNKKKHYFIDGTVIHLDSPFVCFTICLFNHEFIAKFKPLGRIKWFYCIYSMLFTTQVRFD